MDWFLYALNDLECEEGLDVLLDYVEHPDPDMREAVADGLLQIVLHGGEVAQRATEAMIVLAADHEPAVAGNSLWDVAEYPEHFAHVAEDFVRAALLHQDDPGRAGLDAQRVLRLFCTDAPA